MSRGTTLIPAGNVPGAALTRLKSSCVGATPVLIVTVLLTLPKDRSSTPRSVRLTVPSTSAAPVDVPLCCRTAPDAIVRSVLSVNKPLTEASTAPVPFTSMTPFALLTNRPPKFLAPSPVICWATPPVNLTVPLLPTTAVPAAVKVVPAIVKLCAALTVFPVLTVNRPKVVEAGQAPEEEQRGGKEEGG